MESRDSQAGKSPKRSLPVAANAPSSASVPVGGGVQRQAVDDLERARADIRAAGFRATPARIATLLEIRNSPSPMTHADLAERLAVNGFDKATAFRNLNDLANGGLLRRTELGDHVWRFEAIDPADVHDQGHPHFVCVDCGQVTCLDNMKLKVDSRRSGQSFGEVTEILLRGHCGHCQ